MPKSLKLFTKKNSRIVNERGPSPHDQLSSMANDEYWTVLNSSLLSGIGKDRCLVPRVNALKHAIQTYGPKSDKLPDFRHNKGKAQGVVFHGHAADSLGKTFVLEWAIVDEERRLLSLVGFGNHENYPFRQSPLNEENIKRLLGSEESKTTMAKVEEKIAEAKAKAVRISLCVSM